MQAQLSFQEGRRLGTYEVMRKLIYARGVATDCNLRCSCLQILLKVHFLCSVSCDTKRANRQKAYTLHIRVCTGKEAHHAHPAVHMGRSIFGIPGHGELPRGESGVHSGASYATLQYCGLQTRAGRTLTPAPQDDRLGTSDALQIVFTQIRSVPCRGAMSVEADGHADQSAGCFQVLQGNTNDWHHYEGKARAHSSTQTLQASCRAFVPTPCLRL